VCKNASHNILSAAQGGIGHAPCADTLRRRMSVNLNDTEKGCFASPCHDTPFSACAGRASCLYLAVPVTAARLGQTLFLTAGAVRRTAANCVRLASAAAFGFRARCALNLVKIRCAFFTTLLCEQSRKGFARAADAPGTAGLIAPH